MTLDKNKITYFKIQNIQHSLSRVMTLDTSFSRVLFSLFLLLPSSASLQNEEFAPPLSRVEG